MKNTLILTVFIFLVLTRASFSIVMPSKGPEEVTNHISLDSGYIPSLNSNRAMGDFTVEYVQGGVFLYRQTSNLEIIKQNGYLSKGVSALFLIALVPSSELMYHEWGHGSRMKAYGYQDKYGFIAYQGGKFESKTYPNQWIYLGRAIIHPATGGFTTTDGGSEYKKVPKELKGVNQDIIITAGGLNNNMKLAENIENDIYYNNGYAEYVWVYIYDKAHPAYYAYNESAIPGGKGDPTALINDFKKKKYGIERKHIYYANAAAVFGSATTYSLLLNNFGKGLSGNVDPVEFLGVRAPETGFYMTHKGLSLKFNSGYRIKTIGLSFPVSCEVVVKGKKEYEPGFGVRFDTQWVTFGSLTRMNLSTKGKEAEGFVEIPLRYVFMSSFTVTLGVTHYDAKTLNGVRNTPSFENGYTSNELWTKISFYY